MYFDIYRGYNYREITSLITKKSRTFRRSLNFKYIRSLNLCGSCHFEDDAPGSWVIFNPLVTVSSNFNSNLRGRRPLPWLASAHYRTGTIKNWKPVKNGEVSTETDNMCTHTHLWLSALLRLKTILSSDLAGVDKN